ETPANQPAPVPTGQSIEYLGGLRLGMTVLEVDKMMGNRYRERIEEDPGGPFREPFSVRTYPSGCDIVLGHSTGKVLQIEAYTPAFPTAMGIKVGDKSITALQLYRAKYPEWVGNQSAEILPGWFETEPGVLLIYSSQANRERSNYNLGENSQIYSITLGYSRYFD
ncbi:MAG: hypothetical protein GYA42_02720, partial [Syntrophomonadaceae bacterium]|nr:hypothetical protein [Syntrophomonadaceae bacterium]